MSRVTKINKIEPKVCTAEVSNATQMYRLDLDASCHWFASYEIDGKLLCTRHAGIMALKILLEEGR